MAKKAPKAKARQKLKEKVKGKVKNTQQGKPEGENTQTEKQDRLGDPKTIKKLAYPRL